MLLCLYRSQKGWNSWQIGCFLLIFCLGGMRSSVATTAQERMALLVERKILLTGRVVPGSVQEVGLARFSFLLEEKRGRVRVFVRKAGKFRPKQGTVEVQGTFQAPDGFYNPGTLTPETRAAIAGEGGSLEAEGRGLPGGGQGTRLAGPGLLRWEKPCAASCAGPWVLRTAPF